MDGFGRSTSTSPGTSNRTFQLDTLVIVAGHLEGEPGDLTALGRHPRERTRRVEGQTNVPAPSEIPRCRVASSFDDADTVDAPV